MTKIKHPKTMIFFIYVLAVVLVSFSVRADEEPIISVFQGSEKGTSVVEVIWPDQKVEKLLYKDDQAEQTDSKGKTGYQNWFSDRYRAYIQRTKGR